MIAPTKSEIREVLLSISCNRLAISTDAALGFVMKAIAAAGYRPGTDVALALDPASTEFFRNGAYHYEGEGKIRSAEEQVTYLAELVARYPKLL